ncbi:MAG: PepSY domain-containing protein [Acetobacteraceae bacterium]|nr:PepSY domain-containing protein [Acetobacteraceae bacterium]
MSFCPQCGQSLRAGDRFCPRCGLAVGPPPKRPSGLTTVLAIVLPLLLLATVGVVLVSAMSPIPGQAPAGRAPAELEAQLPEGVQDLRYVGRRDYVAGVVLEYQGQDDAGNEVTVLVDRASGALRAFYVHEPPAFQVEAGEDAARHEAELFAQQHCAFWGDPALNQETSELVDLGPGTAKYYRFRWFSQDPGSGAYLLKFVEIQVNPATGHVFFFECSDGEVRVKTVPAVSRSQAEEIACRALKDTCPDAAAADAKLYVTREFSPAQNLVWVIEVEDRASDTAAALVYVDAHSGKVLEIEPFL